MKPRTTTVEGFDTVDRRVGPGGNSGRVFVPKTWIGRRVLVILIDDPDDPLTDS